MRASIDQKKSCREVRFLIAIDKALITFSSKPTLRDRNFICSIGEEGRENYKNEKYERAQSKGQSCSGQEGGEDKKEAESRKPFPSRPETKQFRFTLIGQKAIWLYC